MVGKLFQLGAEAPFRHPTVWVREPTSGPERLRIGGGEHSIDTLLALGRSLAEPVFVLVVLRVPRVGDGAKLESEALSHRQAVGFLNEFRELFQNDARAQVWLGATIGGGLLVLDEHDLIYGYGPLEDFEEALAIRGYTRGDPCIPDPHEHHYNEGLDGLEVRLREWWGWRRILPLEHEDD